VSWALVEATVEAAAVNMSDGASPLLLQPVTLPFLFERWIDERPHSPSDDMLLLVAPFADAMVVQDVSLWLPWFHFGVNCLSANIPVLASCAFLNTARLSGNPDAWIIADFALTIWRP
jgi:hypothetical protein